MTLADAYGMGPRRNSAVQTAGDRLYVARLSRSDQTPNEPRRVEPAVRCGQQTRHRCKHRIRRILREHSRGRSVGRGCRRSDVCARVATQQRTTPSHARQQPRPSLRRRSAKRHAHHDAQRARRPCCQRSVFGARRGNRSPSDNRGPGPVEGAALGTHNRRAWQQISI